MAIAVSGVFSDGFQITGSPQTSASAAFHDQTATGKLKALITAQGPIGCQLSIIRWPGRSDQVHAFQAQTRGVPDRCRIQRVRRQGEVARDRLEVGKAQLDADRFARVALACQVARELGAQLGEDRAELRAVTHRVQVALECRLAADRHRLAVRDHAARIAPMGSLVQPGAVALAEMLDQKLRLSRGDVADRVQTEAREFLGRFRADAVDLLGRERPDARRNFFRLQQRQAIGLVEFRADFRQQLVRRDAHRTAEPGGRVHGLFQREAERAPAVGVHAGQRAQVDVDLVDAAVFDQRCDRAHRGLERQRVLAVFVKVHRQQHRVRREPGRLHHAHRRADAKRPRFVSRGRDHAAPDIVAHPGEAARAVGQKLRLMALPTTDHNRHATQLGVAQQLD